MNSWRKARKQERRITVLTRNSLGRWNIVISILRLVAKTIREKEDQPLVVFSKDLTKLHPTGNVYNVIESLSKKGITRPLRRIRPHDAFSLMVPDGLTILDSEVDVWNEISRTRPLPELQSCALKIIRQSLDEIQTLLKGSTSV